MNRRAFMQSVLLTAVAAPLSSGSLSAQAQAERRRAGWIIPTNRPDRFNLKVMAFNPIPAPDLAAWELTIEGLDAQPVRLKAADLDRLPRVTQSSRLKCVQCWSGRVNWEGFRAGELLKLVRSKSDLRFVRVDCADKYYDFVKIDDPRFDPMWEAAGAQQLERFALVTPSGRPLRIGACWNPSRHTSC